MMDSGHTLTCISGDPAETFRLGRILGGTLEEGAIVALIGELGAGKTRLTQGIARGLGVPDAYPVTSPTFTLINEYPGRRKLVHFDAYRLTGAADLPELGCEEYFYGKGVVVVEWAERIRDVLPDGTLFITMAYLDETRRRVEICGPSAQVLSIAHALRDGGF
jgi:tRNA threonylcarbamoyladenosine biosynthesis protein TsaE